MGIPRIPRRGEEGRGEEGRKEERGEQRKWEGGESRGRKERGKRRASHLVHFCKTKKISSAILEVRPSRLQVSMFTALYGRK